MKKNNIFKVLALILVVVLAMTLLSGCAQKLSGKYVHEVFGQEMAYSFNGDAVTFSVTILGKVSSETGTYSINDAGDEITMSFENSKLDDVANGTFAFSISEDKSEITIGTLTYTKAE